MNSETSSTWIGKSVKRHEDPRLLTGRGIFVDDITVPGLHHAAILRSPHAHALIKGIDASEALKLPGVFAVVTGKDVLEKTKPFAVVVKSAFKYYCAAIHKVRFVGEPVAVVVASDRYIAEDAAALIQVDYEALPPLVDVEKAMLPDAPVLHDEVGNNISCHRILNYGDVDTAFREADLILKERFVFPRYSSVPLEGFAVIADYDQHQKVLTIWSNFMGPFTLHPVTAMALNIPENKLRFIVAKDIGGSFGIKSSIYPYIVLIGLAAMKSGRPVKWIEDRQEHLMASSSQTDRVSYREVAFKKDGTMTGIKTKILDNVGAYLRAPEPATTFRPVGNYVGPYKVKNMRVEAYDMMTNKCPTGPNRGYGCQQIYFEQERMMDMAAEKLGIDPAEIRFRNFIGADEFPYTTPSGGIYDSGDYPAGLKMALEMGPYEKLKEERDKLRSEGRLVGIGIAVGVDPSVSNMGYITVAASPEARSHPGYLPKSGAAESATVKMDPLGGVTVLMNSTPQGQGHETVVAQIIADELGVTPDDVVVVENFDTSESPWSVSSGTYSSRFASVGTSAAVTAARKIKDKMFRIVGNMMQVPPESLSIGGGKIFVTADPSRNVSLKRVAGAAHWDLQNLPPGMEAGLEARGVFNFPLAGAPDSQDRVNSSNTYGFMAEVMLLEVFPDSGQLKILRYISVHDAGTIINPKIVEGQIYGGALHGIAGAIFEEFVYDDEGQFLTGSFMDYLVPTASEAPKIEIGHICSPSPFTPLGSKGAGESSSETVPVLIANAVADALRHLNVRVTDLPLNPKRVWSLIHEQSSQAPKQT